MNSEPWEVREQSKVGGLVVVSFHRRTVASREAERTRSGVGKATPRTWKRFDQITNTKKLLGFCGILRLKLCQPASEIPETSASCW